jgi:hypothetical protein
MTIGALSVLFGKETGELDFAIYTSFALHLYIVSLGQKSRVVVVGVVASIVRLWRRRCEES